jgi:hypothetical protein
MKGLLQAVCVAAMLAGPALATGKEEPKPTPGQTQEQGQGQAQGQAQGQTQGQGQSVHIEGGVGGIACDFGIAIPGGSLCLPRSNRHAKILAEADALGLAYGEWARLRHICLHVPRVKRTLGACPVAPLTNQDYTPGGLK